MQRENPNEDLASAGPALRRPPEPWTLLDLLFFTLFAFMAVVLTGFAALTAYAMLRPAMGWHLSPRALGQNTFFLLGVQLASYFLIFGYIYFLVVFHYRFRFWEGIKWGHLNAREIVQYVAAGVAMTLGIQMVSAFLPEKAGFPLERMFSSPGAAYALAAFAIVVGPFMEELIFRGVLFSIFEARAGLPITIMITAALFAAMHIPEYRGAWYHVLFIFLVGLVLSLARGLTQSLAPSVILHITYNTCLMVVLFFATSQFHAIQGAMK